MDDKRTKALFFRLKGGYTLRYHGIRMIKEDPVGHHSYNVAQILRYIAAHLPAPRLLLLLEAALDHDVAEHIVGDLPAPTKRKIPGLQDLFAEYEAKVMAEHGLECAEGKLLEDERKLLKAADAMDGMRFCIQERMMGNRFAEGIYETFASYVRALNLDANGRAYQLYSLFQMDMEVARGR